MLPFFDLREYFTHISYPAQIEIWLTATPLGDDVSANLADYAEADFNGYARITGSKDDLFADPSIDNAGVSVSSKLLSWLWKGGPPLHISAALVVAVWPDGSRQLVQVVPNDWTFTHINPALSFCLVISASSIAA